MAVTRSGRRIPWTSISVCRRGRPEEDRRASARPASSRIHVTVGLKAHPRPPAVRGMLTGPIPVAAITGIGRSPHDDSVGLLGLIGTPGQGHRLAWPVDRVRQFGDRKEGRTMPIDPALLAKSIATLTDLDPQRDLAATLEQTVVAAKQLFMVDAAGIMLADANGRLRWASASDPLAQTLEDNQETYAAGPCLQAFASGQPAIICDATLEPEWGELTLAFVELEIRSGLSVPVELGGGPIGTLDVYAAAPGGWDATEVSALQTFAGLVATLLGTAAQAQSSGRLAEQLQIALDARILIEWAKGALMERKRLDDQQAFIDLRRAARTSRREPPDGAGE